MMHVALISLDYAGGTGSSVLVTAVQWVEDALLGTVATAIAVIAVASIGFMMLTGRINVRRGGTIVLGCFILFGAKAMVSGLQSAMAGSPGPAPVAAPPPAPPPLRPAPTPTVPRAPYDPYAGASVPR